MSTSHDSTVIAGFCHYALTNEECSRLLHIPVRKLEALLEQLGKQKKSPHSTMHDLTGDFLHDTLMFMHEIPACENDGPCFTCETGSKLAMMFEINNELLWVILKMSPNFRRDLIYTFRVQNIENRRYVGLSRSTKNFASEFWSSLIDSHRFLSLAATEYVGVHRAHYQAKAIQYHNDQIYSSIGYDADPPAHTVESWLED